MDAFQVFFHIKAFPFFRKLNTTRTPRENNFFDPSVIIVGKYLKKPVAAPAEIYFLKPHVNFTNATQNNSAFVPGRLQVVIRRYRLPLSETFIYYKRVTANVKDDQRRYA